MSLGRRLVGSNSRDSMDGVGGNDYFDARGGNDTLYGNGGNDTLLGGDGDDLLHGGAGDDFMDGGAGNDQYYIDTLNDKIIEAANGGRDTVHSFVNYRLGDHLENLHVKGIATRGEGNALDNFITGSELVSYTLLGGLGDDTITGGFKDDQLFGGDGTDQLDGGLSIGNDLLDGGAGADVMRGGDGGDTYVVDNPSDVVQEVAAHRGTDHIQSWISMDLTASGVAIENLTLMGQIAKNGFGNDLANVIVGNSVSNVLKGGLGNDSLTGGIGADTLSGGQGNDVFVYNAVSESAFSNAKDTRDIIEDLQKLDIIDLSAIDAIEGTAKNDSFTFKGQTKSFSGTNAAGQIRFEYDKATRSTTVYASTDADMDAELEIFLPGVTEFGIYNLKL